MHELHGTVELVKQWFEFFAAMLVKMFDMGKMNYIMLFSTH